MCSLVRTGYQRGGAWAWRGMARCTPKKGSGTCVQTAAGLGSSFSSWSLSNCQKKTVRAHSPLHRLRGRGGCGFE